MSTENTPGPGGPKVCAACLVPLDYIANGDGSGGRYAHMFEEFGKRTHVAVPVDPDEVTDIAPFCDFCHSKEGVNWTVVTHPFTINMVLPDQEVQQNYSALWAACEQCATLVRRRRFKALVTRVANEAVKKRPLTTPAHYRVLKQNIGILYAAVEANFVALREISKDDAYDPFVDPRKG